MRLRTEAKKRIGMMIKAEKRAVKFALWSVAALAAVRFITGIRQMLQSREKDVDLLARTIWGEDNVGGYDGMLAVANVVRNRVRAGGWWGATYSDVILKPYQFSIWNAKTVERYENNPMFAAALDRIENVTTATPFFALAQQIAAAVYDGKIGDNTGGATHYKLPTAAADWAEGLTPVAHIGSHDFYITS